MESTLDCGLEGTGAGVSFFTSLSSQWLAPPLDTAADEKRAPSVIVKFVSIKVKLRIVAGACNERGAIKGSIFGD